MVKKWFAVGMAVLLVCLAAVGCGIPQEEHDAMIAERDTGLAKVASLESDLSATESELETTENILEETEDDLAATQSDLAATQSELADAESQVSSLKSAASKAKSDLSAARDEVSELEGFKTDVDSLWDSLSPKLELISQIAEVFALYEADESVQMAAAFFGLGSYIDAVGDTELSELWDEVMDLFEEEKYVESDLKFAEAINRALELVEEDIEAIEARLSE